MVVRTGSWFLIFVTDSSSWVIERLLQSAVPLRASKAVSTGRQRQLPNDPKASQPTL